MMHLVAGCVMEGSMVFCQNNILEHSMRFHGDYLKRWLLTHGQSDILTHRHKVHLCKRTFFYTENIKTNLRREGFVMVKLVGIPDRLVVALLHDVLQVGTVGSVAPFRQFRKIDRLKESLASS
jgi:hypothetical protein